MNERFIQATIETQYSDRGVRAGAKGFRELEESARGAAKGANQGIGAYTQLSGMLKGLVASAVLVKTAQGLKSIAMQMVNAASDAEEMQSKFAFVFGELGDEVTRELDAFAEATGRSSFGLRGMASDVGAVLQSLVDAPDVMADMSANLAQLAVDLGSFYNVAESDAMAALTSGLIGEAEPMRRFGVLLSEAAVQSYILSNGIANSKSEITDQMKVQARYNIILAQTATAQGDAERTANSFANQSRALQSGVKDLTTEMGEALLPAATEIVQTFAELVNDVGPGLVRLMEDLGPAASGAATIISDQTNLMVLTTNVHSLRSELNELGVTGAELKGIMGELAEFDLFRTEDDYTRDIERQTEAIERMRLTVALVNRGFTATQAAAWMEGLRDAGVTADNFSISAMGVQEALNQLDATGVAPTWEELNDALIAVSGSSSKTSYVQAILREEMGLTQVSARDNAEFLSALQVALVLAGEGYEGSAQQTANFVLSLLNSETPIATAIQMTRQMDDTQRDLNPTLIENEIALNRQRMAQEESSAAQADAARISQGMFAEIVRSTGALTDAQQAALDKAIADNASAEQIGALIGAYGELTPSQIDNINAIVAAQLAIEGLNASDADYVQQLAQLTSEIDINTAALFNNANARLTAAQRQSIRVPIRSGLADLGVRPDDYDELADLLSADAAQIADDVEAANERVVQSYGAVGSEMRDVGRDAEALGDAIEDASERIVDIEERRDERISGLRERASERELALTERTAERRVQIEERASEQIDNIREQNAQRWQDYYDEIERRQDEFVTNQAQRRDDLVDAFARAEGDENVDAPGLSDLHETYTDGRVEAGAYADEIGRIKEETGAASAEAAAAAARFQAFEEAYQSLARAEHLTEDERRKAREDLDKQFAEGLPAPDVSEHNFVIEDANEYAERVTRERLERVQAAEREAEAQIYEIKQQAKADITQLEADTAAEITQIQTDLKEETGRIWNEANEQIGDILGDLEDKFIESFGNATGQGEALRSKLVEIEGQLAMIPAVKELTIRYTYETVGSPPPDAGNAVPSSSNAGNDGGVTAPNAPAGGDQSFALGGYTGDGLRHQIAGRVHRREYVLNDIVRMGGPGAVARELERRDPAFAQGDFARVFGQGSELAQLATSVTFLPVNHERGNGDGDTSVVIQHEGTRIEINGVSDPLTIGQEVRRQLREQNLELVRLAKGQGYKI